MNDELLTALRYKSEGTDIDFKSQQYRFAGASDHEKSEMLKDVLAMANAWRGETGYILLGLKDQRPHPAEVVGITESIDDATLQQFVNSKIKPKLTFQYEEHLYEGETIGVITIPKQKRPFFLINSFGKLKKNIVYVRRGSSTDEAEPSEIIDMGLADAGRTDMKVDLSVLTPANNDLPDSFSLCYLRFDRPLPDYESPPEHEGPFYSRANLWSDNRRFWREAGEYVRLKSALIEMQFVLLNRSGVQLSNAKLEVTVEPLDGQGIEMHAGANLPSEPKSQRALHEIHSPSNFPLGNDERFVIDEGGSTPLCHVRFGSLLPGEQGRSTDTLAIVPLGAGRLRLRFRVLASELSTPIESDRVLETTGDVNSLDLDGFQDFLRERGKPIQAGG